MNRCQAHLSHALRRIKKKENSMPGPKGFRESSDKQPDKKTNGNQSNQEIKPLNVRESNERLRQEQQTKGTDQSQHSPRDPSEGKPGDLYGLVGHVTKILDSRGELKPKFSQQLEGVTRKLEQEQESKADVRERTDEIKPRNSSLPDQIANNRRLERRLFEDFRPRL